MKNIWNNYNISQAFFGTGGFGPPTFLHLFQRSSYSCGLVCTVLYRYNPVIWAQKTPHVLSLCLRALTQPFPDLFVSFQTTQRGSWPAAEAGRSRTRPSSTCPSSYLTANSRSRPAPARWPSACAAVTRRAMSCRAMPRRTVCPRASAGERSLPSWPASLSCWVSYYLLLWGCADRSQWAIKWYLISQHTV